MKKIVHMLTLLLFVLAGCSGITAVQDQAPENIVGTPAQVVNVVDGDTIDVKLDNEKKERVRFVLVDTPETKHPQIGVQPFGKEAEAFTKKHLEGKKILLELDVSERDRYGRVLAYIWLGNQNFNRLLIEEGLARVAIFPPDVKYLDDFEAAQDLAREQRKGIWSIEDYVHDKGFQSEENSPAKKEENGKCAIKGNINRKQEKIYHVPGGQYYDRVKPEVWFCTVEEAEKAGFRAPKR